jgi:hypothetical protein
MWVPGRESGGGGVNQRTVDYEEDLAYMGATWPVEEEEEPFDPKTGERKRAEIADESPSGKIARNPSVPSEHAKAANVVAGHDQELLNSPNHKHMAKNKKSTNKSKRRYWESRHQEVYQPAETTDEWLESMEFINEAPEASTLHQANVMHSRPQESVRFHVTQRRRVAHFLTRDVRVLSYLSTILREIATMPVEGLFIHVVRTEIFAKMCTAINRSALRVHLTEGVES